LEGCSCHKPENIKRILELIGRRFEGLDGYNKKVSQLADDLFGEPEHMNLDEMDNGSPENSLDHTCASVLFSIRARYCSCVHPDSKWLTKYNSRLCPMAVQEQAAY
jgi:hypothetical protein